jgi:integrase
LVAFFGADATIDSITAENADAWRVWVVKDKEGSGRRQKKRTTEDNRLSPPTVAKRVSVAKQVFRCAVRWGWLDKSPFDGLRPDSQVNPARARYVPVETIRDVIDACPSVEWRLVVGLARYAGLRCPTEVGELAWGDMNWAKGRLTVRAMKTEHHGGDHSVRVVPISPELREILADAFEQAEPGAKEIAPMATRKGVNLRMHLERFIAKAGHEVWPRLFQNLRASCATDWVERYPSHVVATWLGHSPKVAAQHYLMSRDHHFEDAVSGESTVPVAIAGEDPNSVGSCDANCDSAGGHTGQHTAARNDRTRGHHSGERGFFGSCVLYQNSPAARGRAKNSPPGPWMARRA